MNKQKKNVRNIRQQIETITIVAIFAIVLGRGIASICSFNDKVMGLIISEEPQEKVKTNQEVSNLGQLTEKEAGTEENGKLQTASNKEDVITLEMARELAEVTVPETFQEKVAETNSVEVRTEQEVEAETFTQVEEYTQEEIDMLCMLVHNEAIGESFEGKVAVARVPINRLKDGRFGSTLKEVIYAPSQFATTKVSKETISKYPEIEEAVMAAINGKDPVKDAIGEPGLGFYNPDRVSEKAAKTRSKMSDTSKVIIGHHCFYGSTGMKEMYN